MKTINSSCLRDWLHDSQEIALLDVREYGQYGECHPLYAAPLPYSRLEIDVRRLAPNTRVRIVLLDEDGKLSPKAAQRLEALGYGRVFVLDGGMRAWQADGGVVFSGVNVVSKAFGEIVEHHYKTPSLSATELTRMLEEGNTVLLLDGRPFAEYQKMTIPGAICCPNGELGLWIRDIVPDDETPIVVNCAGRTRSIIGAQTLISLGLKNPVYSLRNGTMGWTLDDLTLEYGATRHHPMGCSPAGLAEARAAAASLASCHEVQTIGSETLLAWMNDASRTTFLLDVRTAEEFSQGSLAGAQHAPGGQLVQCTDQYVGVRNARLVLVDDDDVRAPIVASWLRQMGHDATVLEGGVRSGVATTTQRPSSVPDLPTITADELARGLNNGTLVAVDVRASTAFRSARIPGSVWSIRPLVGGLLAKDTRPVVFIADEAQVAALCAMELAPQMALRARLLNGGLDAWRGAGHAASAAGEDELPDTQCLDYLFFVHDRHHGNRAAAVRYLTWETGLVGQMSEREVAAFRLPAHSSR